MQPTLLAPDHDPEINQACHRTMGPVAVGPSTGGTVSGINLHTHTDSYGTPLRPA